MEIKVKTEKRNQVVTNCHRLKLEVQDAKKEKRNHPQ